MQSLSVRIALEKGRLAFAYNYSTTLPTRCIYHSFEIRMNKMLHQLQ